MRKIKHYQNNCWNFYKKVLHNKKDKNLKARLNLLDSVTSACFFDYDSYFNYNQLERLSPKTFSDDEKEDLRSLYSYKFRSFKDLKEELICLPDGTLHPLCPYCGINEVNTFDHLLPQGEFAEFAANPKNLLPACSACNSKRGDAWRENGIRNTLNLYIDKIPPIQFLFVDLQIDNNAIRCNFYLQNTSIDSALFDKIYNHYDRLNLCERFKNHSANLLSKLKNDLMANAKNLSIQELQDATIESANANKARFGINYWESVLKIACAQNEQIFLLLLK